MNVRRHFISIFFLITSDILFDFVHSRKGHLEPLGNSGTMEPLHESVGFIHPKEFLSDYILKNKPVIMRKAILDSTAILQWTDKYLKEAVESNDSEVAVEYGKKETRLNGTTMLFSKFLEIYNNSDVYMVNSMPKPLEKDVIIPWPLQCDDYKRSFEDNVMWFSSGGTKSVIHHDGYENINCLIRGKKRFIFVNRTKYADVEDEIITYQNGSYGSVDVERVDLDKYPVYEGMEFFNADLNPGDCVYSPFKWIHQVESWNSNIAVNMWWFREVNNLIDTSTCSDVYDQSYTFSKAKFHKTTVLEDGQNMDTIVFAARHSIARFLFKSVNRPYVNAKEFVVLLTKGAVGLRKSDFRDFFSFFRTLDINKNKKFDDKDLDEEVDDDEISGIYENAVQWITMAKLYKCPMPTDFTDNSYLSVKAFQTEELDQAYSGEKNENMPNRDEL